MIRRLAFGPRNNMETQTSIFGNLDTALCAVERSKNVIQKRLAEGKERMRKGDIMRARNYIKNIEPQLRNIKVALKEFESFAS